MFHLAREKGTARLAKRDPGYLYRRLDLAPRFRFKLVESLPIKMHDKHQHTTTGPPSSHSK